MSWTFDFCDPVTNEVLKTDEKHNMFGGTVCVGGTNAMTLDVTYNYGVIINTVIDGHGDTYAKFFNEKTGAKIIPILKEAISKLADDVDEDYWTATEGNAKRALCQLLALAQIRPDAVIHVY